MKWLSNILIILNVKSLNSLKVDEITNFKWNVKWLAI